MIIRSLAPNRIDLAGGTLDIFPLYILLGTSITINIAIDIFSNCTLENISENEYIEIEIKDLNRTYKIKDLNQIKEIGETKLIYETFKTLNIETLKGYKITTYNEAPLKSGLGASSALLITIIKNLLKINKSLYTNYNDYDIIDTASFIEAKVLHTLTGKQDYIAAIYGGINIIFFDKNQYVIEKVNQQELIKNLENHIVLAYSGFEHESGNLNWKVVKNALDKEIETINKLKKIQEISEDLYELISTNDIQKIGLLVKQEWEIRKTLTKEHTNPIIDNFLNEVDKYSFGYKLCGAAGGGTIFIITNQKEKVLNTIKDFNLINLPFKINTSGLITTIEL
jgi:D-glycero-alpha-D-manno-heptose-7-phosphate kinase